jgi:hypothetical protein
MVECDSAVELMREACESRVEGSGRAGSIRFPAPQRFARGREAQRSPLPLLRLCCIWLSLCDTPLTGIGRAPWAAAIGCEAAGDRSYRYRAIERGKLADPIPIALPC